MSTEDPEVGAGLASRGGSPQAHGLPGTPEQQISSVEAELNATMVNLFETTSIALEDKLEAAVTRVSRQFVELETLIGQDKAELARSVQLVWGEVKGLRSQLAQLDERSCALDGRVSSAEARIGTDDLVGQQARDLVFTMKTVQAVQQEAEELRAGFYQLAEWSGSVGKWVDSAEARLNAGDKTDDKADDASSIHKMHEEVKKVRTELAQMGQWSGSLDGACVEALKATGRGAMPACQVVDLEGLGDPLASFAQSVQGEVEALRAGLDRLPSVEVRLSFVERQLDGVQRLTTAALAERAADLRASVLAETAESKERPSSHSVDPYEAMREVAAEYFAPQSDQAKAECPAGTYFAPQRRPPGSQRAWHRRGGA